MVVNGVFWRSFEELENFEPLLLESGFKRHCCGMSESNPVGSGPGILSVAGVMIDGVEEEINPLEKGDATESPMRVVVRAAMRGWVGWRENIWASLTF